MSIDDNFVQQLRENVVEKFMMIVDSDHTLAKNLEVSALNATINEWGDKGVLKKWDNHIFRDLYIHKCISLFANIDPLSYIGNQNLIQRLKSGEIKPYDVGNLKPQELFPEKWAQMLIDKEKEANMAFEVRTEIASDAYTCSRCKGQKVTYYQRQTRSCDEPMTTFITCILCNKRWKI
jgi:DNA-directed RNA polymerase subunit M/transcription elongation factor TFIIS